MNAYFITYYHRFSREETGRYIWFRSDMPFRSVLASARNKRHDKERFTVHENGILVYDSVLGEVSA